MATSKCGACGLGRFEIRELNFSTATGETPKFRFSALQCASCGVIVGTHENMNIGSALLVLDKRLADLESTVASIAHAVAAIQSRMH